MIETFHRTFLLANLIADYYMEIQNHKVSKENYAKTWIY